MTSADNPLVSIIVPAYNAERYLARAIRSALGQTYANFELIVVDDGSTDRTPDVIASFKDSRICHLAQPNRGQGSARNRGIGASRGRYVTFLDADDAYLPEKIQRQLEYLVSHPTCHAVFCRVLHCYEREQGRLFEGRRWRPAAEIFRDLLRGSRINPNTLMVAGDVLRGGFFFSEERYYPEEWDLCLRLAAAGYRFGYQDEPLVVVEIRDDSNTAMEIQWILKRHTVEMLERFFAGMNERERRSMRATRVLRSCRCKLAFAALVSENPRDALRASSDALPRCVARLLDGVLRVIPPNVARAAVGAAWKFRQRRSLSEVRDGVIGEAWSRVLGLSAPRMPRVLQLITLSDFGGAQQCVLSLATGLRDHYDIAVACGPGGAMMDRLRRDGVRVITIESLTRTPHPLRDLQALWTLTRLMRRERFEVVHCHSTKAGLLGRIAARLAGVPAVAFTAHGWQFLGEWPSALRWAMIAAEWVAGWFSTAIICVSEYDRRVAMAYHIGRPDRLVVVHNGVDPAPWPRGTRAPDAAGEPRAAVAVGRLTPAKDPITLVQAWALVPGNHRLILVGDGPLRAEVEVAVRRVALGDRVQVLPPSTDIPALMRTAHVFVMSSRWEGLPLAVIEAMMSGLPVVATRVGGVPEVVVEGETGLLVPAGDPAALAAALRRVLDDPSLAYRMGQAGRQRALAYFTEARMVAETDSVYTRMLMAAARAAAATPP